MNEIVRVRRVHERLPADAYRDGAGRAWAAITERLAGHLAGSS
jgi:hypothetical protein